MSRRPPCCLLVALFWLAPPLAAATPPVGVYMPFGPGSGLFLSLVADPSAPATLFGVSYRGEVYRSTDGGRTWAWASTGLREPRRLGNLVADPGRPGVFYLLIVPFSSIFDEGLYRSVDGGATWANLLTLPRLLIPTTELWLVPGTPATLLARFENGSFGAVRAVPGSDTPVSWQPVDGSAGPPFAVNASLPGTVYGVSRVTRGGLVVSHDSGATWTPLAGPGGPVTLLALAGGPTPGILAATPAGLFVSTDGGATWSSTGVPGATALAAGPGSAVYAAEGGHFYASGDGGHTFAERSRGLPVSAIVQIVVDGSGRPYVLNRIGQAWSATPGGGFRIAGQRGLLEGDSLPIVIDPGDPSLLYLTLFGTRGQTFRSTDGGAGWAPLGRFLSEIVLDPLHPTRLLAIDQGNVVASDDGGDSFGPPLLAGSFQSLAQLSSRLFLAGGCGIERSVNGGRTWAVTLPCRHDGVVDQVQRLHVDPHDAATAYAEVTEMQDLPVCQTPKPRAGCLSTPLYRSRNEGRTWTRLPITGHGLALGGARRTALYLQGDSGPLGSDNGGDSWRPLPVPDPFHLANILLAADPTRGDGAYATGITESGVSILYSPDRGRNWKEVEVGGLDRFHRGLPAWLVPDPRTPGRLYVGLPNGGVFAVQVQR